MRKGVTTLICLLLVAITLAGCLDRLVMDQDDSYDLGTHVYRAVDTSSSPTENESDVLISIYWTHVESIENALLWNSTTIHLEVRDSVYECHTSIDQESGEHCLIDQDGENHYLWESSEFLTLSENGTDIVSSSDTNVKLHIIYRGERIPGTSEVLVQ